MSSPFGLEKMEATDHLGNKSLPSLAVFSRISLGWLVLVKLALILCLRAQHPAGKEPGQSILLVFVVDIVRHKSWSLQ